MISEKDFLDYIAPMIRALKPGQLWNTEEQVDNILVLIDKRKYDLEKGLKDE